MLSELDRKRNQFGLNSVPILATRTRVNESNWILNERRTTHAGNGTRAERHIQETERGQNSIFGTRGETEREVNDTSRKWNEG
jgi:hypothetical protein